MAKTDFSFSRRTAGRCRFSALMGLAAVLLAGTPHPALAAMELEGDPNALKVTVAEVPREQIMAMLAQRFTIQLAGTIAAGGEPVSGIFRGDLGDVIAGVLVSNNFLIIYEGGRPARILISEKGEAAVPVDPGMRVLQQGGGTAIGSVGYGNSDIQPNGDPNGQVQYMQPPGSGSDRPEQYDPDSGLPIDPATGFPIDPATGQPIDPATGMPVDPSAGQGN